MGGVYREICMRPHWDRYFGSGGRAAAALTALGIPTTLNAYADNGGQAAFESMAALDPTLKLALIGVPMAPSFRYTHGLSVPLIEGRSSQASLPVQAEAVLRFGMIEGEAVVHAHRAVYDPQDVRDPKPFHANGSKADELALVLNLHEASLLLKRSPTNLKQMAEDLARQHGASIVVIKCGPSGTLVFDNGKFSDVPAYETRRVWKIGSGDQFAAQFAAGWLARGLDAHAAADRASRATAYYCEHRGSFPSDAQLETFHPQPLPTEADQRLDRRPLVYLAGPFFNLTQLWLIEQARTALLNMHLDVFSPYHDVGHGSADDVVTPDLDGIRRCDVLLALVDGLDPGTIYEVGYACAIGKPAVIYSESESIEDRKMMQGSGCILSEDFVSAVYHTAWAAARA